LWLTLLLVNILLLFVGAWLETGAAIIILVPILSQLPISLGMDPIHFGVIVVLNLVIGMITPPLGVCLFVGAAIAEISMERLIKAVLPFYIALIVGLILVTYIPWLTLWIPQLVMK